MREGSIILHVVFGMVEELVWPLLCSICIDCPDEKIVMSLAGILAGAGQSITIIMSAVDYRSQESCLTFPFREMRYYRSFFSIVNRQTVVDYPSISKPQSIHETQHC